MAKYLEITSENGQAKITAFGFKGRECLGATAPYEQALGKVVSDVELPELKQQTGAQQKQQLRPGSA